MNTILLRALFLTVVCGVCAYIPGEVSNIGLQLFFIALSIGTGIGAAFSFVVCF